MKILIVGAQGQVGKELVEIGKEKHLNVIGFGSQQLNIIDINNITNIILQNSPTVVINAAAYTAVDKAETEKDKAYAVNRDGVANLASVCRENKIPLLHISTDYVFDGRKQAPYTEEDKPDPINVYGASKLAGEEVLSRTWEQHIILRASWIFGRYGNNFVKTMLDLANTHNELKVVNDQMGTPMGARNIALVLLAIASSDSLGTQQFPWGVWHLSSYPTVTRYEFAKEIFKQVKNESSIRKNLLKQVPELLPATSSDFPTLAKRPNYSCLVSSRKWPADISAVFDWRKELSWALSQIL